MALRGLEKFLRFAPIPVDLHNSNSALGHRFRDGEFTTRLKDPGTIPTDHVPTLIIGGGISGLSAGWWLSRNGRADYELLELETNVGGNSASGGNSVSEYPWGAHYLPIPNAESKWVALFLKEIGLITGFDVSGKPIFDEAKLCMDPVERLFIEGRFQDGLVPQFGLTDGERAEISLFFNRVHTFMDLRGKDGKPIFSIPIAEGSEDRFTAKAVIGLDHLSMAEWLGREGFTTKPLLWYLNYCCRDDFGGTLATTSAWAGIHYHASRRGVAANADPQNVLTSPEGNGWLVKKLRERNRGILRTGEIAIAVDPVRGWVETFHPETNRSRIIAADSIILATPRFIASRLLGSTDGIDIDSLAYVPWMVANLTLSDIPGTSKEGKIGASAWDNVSYYGDSLGYVVATHQTQTIGRETVITHYWPLTEGAPAEARRKAAQTSPDEWKEKILSDLEVMHPDIRSITKRIDLRVWGHGMIRPSVGFLSGTQRLAMEKSVGRVHFAHSDISGMSIFEEAQYRGILAAEKILKPKTH